MLLYKYSTVTIAPERFINLLLFPLPMTDILVTNDDGYKSAGFVALVKELAKKYSVTAVVPDRGRSWIGKAITTKKELKLRRITYDDVDMFLLNGTPADCVQIGLYDAVDTRPKMVLSGINIGLNIGQARTLSSGTIGAAIEGSIDGVRSIATSLSIPMNIRDKKTDFYTPESNQLFENAAKITTKVTTILMDKAFVGVDLFSLNIPFHATVDTPLEITTLFRTRYGRLFHKKGSKYLHQTPPIQFKNMDEGSDLKALNENKISLTPMNISFVANHSLKNVETVFHQEW
ncbi:MAG TPA: 5'/3'-nucleotidase SurE [Thermoplasmata archaeon]|jgi:5'-nucleotidase|nr:MAG TPA: 5'/3'-nucleotidase SurE [Thermoplasmata archaeon]